MRLGPCTGSPPRSPAARGGTSTISRGRGSGRGGTCWTQAAQSRLFDFIGHADVIKVCGHRPAEDVSDLYESAASAFASSGVCVEINTAGWRKPVGEIYPAARFLQACRRAGVPVLINSDAHIPEDVGRDFGRAAAYAEGMGYTEVATFASRTRRMVPLA